MSSPYLLHPADWGGEVGEIQNASGRTLFRSVAIDWSLPRRWMRDEAAPTGLDEFERGYLYALLRDHHRSKRRLVIEYVGLTENLSYRFYNHSTARKVRDMTGQTSLSIGEVDFGRYHRRSGTKPSIEE